MHESTLFCYFRGQNSKFSEKDYGQLLGANSEIDKICPKNQKLV